MSTIDPVDDNPFRRPPGGASAGANPVPNTPAHSADAVSGTGRIIGSGHLSCDQLAQANATAAQTENVGAHILSTLGMQREQLIGASDTLAQQRSDLARGGQLVGPFKDATEETMEKPKEAAQTGMLWSDRMIQPDR